MKQVQGETDLLHRTFILSIAAKGLFGIFETLSAFAAWFISAQQIAAFKTWLASITIVPHPTNTIAKLVYELTANLDTSGTHYAAMYLAFHGLTKVILVWALFRDKKWAYPWMLGALVLFIVTQTVQLIAGFTIGLFLLTIFDIFVLWLTWREYKLHRSRKASAAS